jgi:RNA polymerase sigma-70 factor (ECF subfamily)
MTDDPELWRERALRDAALSGDAAAWGRWLGEAFAPVAAYVRWRCGGRPDLADDALQEAWLVAARRLGSFDPARARFAAWVCGIAANVVRDRLRAVARDRRRTQPLADAPEPTDRVPDRDRAERVAVALDRLPDRYERALRAKYLDGRSVAQIAAEWGETEKAVESVLTRARQAFREAFDHAAGGD